LSKIGIVTIGRDEGERFRLCLNSVAGRGHTVVYVDSGSTDGSIALARSLGVDVVEMDLSTPFTHSRARNEGIERLVEIDPGVEFVHMVDGDCELIEGWIGKAQDVLESRPDAVAVCGRRRERFRDQTIYNRLADLEWNTPVGVAGAFGGEALVRVEPLRAIGAYDSGVIAGEDDEMCVRLRKRGWKILRIDAEMSLHDMAMTHFAQWWRRSVRSGYAFAEGAVLHGAPPERHFVRQVRSVAFWGLFVPLLTLALAWPTSGASVLLLFGYVLLVVRTYQSRRRRGDTPGDCRLYAFFCVLGKFPQSLGLGRYWLGRLSGRRSAVIEYRQARTILPVNSTR
jgi:glycosyltransferase involved in cell wall biosynthesis